ncbi:beta-galactosidase [Phytoactinopolyspora limicola]|uniref:beta-galactosidase n=1 Tax=Phytoactinopolyspora limicola TaxID=2715536 RepID=UPI001A9C5878|nr:beta-galactosidase [Phytoactinopolyspora limicola]
MNPTTSRLSRLEAIDGLAYGGDYNPDQWPEDVWAEDARLMREAGVNLVSLPVFSWPRLEPEPGRFDFSWLDRVLDVLWSQDIRVDLATGTATPPAWLIRAHPEILPVTADGVRLEFGSRQAYCPSSPVFREHALRLTEAMARRYGHHDAVVLWHVSNEYGDHVSRCYCAVSAGHFRRWLQHRYENLATLNDAWGTTCWGQHYTDWEQIEPPRRATGPINPTQRLDFERFSSDAMLELFRAEVELLRERTPQLPVTTNFMSLFRELNYWDFAAVEDIVTDDAYPDPADPVAHTDAALNYGLMRALKNGQPWLLLEQAPSAVSWRDVNVPKPPGRMRLGSLHAIAHGSDAAMFFQWRAARFGPEKFHSAMLGHRGVASRSYQECRDFGAELRRLAELKGSRVESRVGVVVDWDAWWGLDAPDSLPSARLDWLHLVRTWHRALYTLGFTVDPVRATGPFDGYDVVVAPNLYLIDDAVTAALAGYADQGGRLVVGPFSGVSDREDKIHPGGAPGPLRSLLGVSVDEWWPLPDGHEGRVKLGATTLGFTTWAEWIDAESADVIATYDDGPLAGRPAITTRRAGAGTATYVSAGLDEAALRQVLGPICRDAGLTPHDTPSLDVEQVTRYRDGDRWTFILNHGTVPARTDVPNGTDLLTGDTVSGPVTVAPAGALVVRHTRS